MAGPMLFPEFDATLSTHRQYPKMKAMSNGSPLECAKTNVMLDVASKLSAESSLHSKTKRVPMARRLSGSSGGTSSTLSSSREKVSSSRIRSNYLHRLGVVRPQSQGSASRTESSKSKLPAHVQVLKDDLSRDDMALTKFSPPQFSKSNPGAKVCFLPCVTVHRIPNRKEYSQEAQCNMWMTSEELDEAVYRNYLEYASEQYDWRNAVDEKDFVLVQGRVMHPAHAHVYQQQQYRYNMNRQFCMIFSAQQQQQQNLHELSSLLYEHEHRLAVN